jgi:hypothetical protein
MGSAPLHSPEADLPGSSTGSSNTQDFPAGNSYEFDEETLKEANALLEIIGQPPVDTSTLGGAIDGEVGSGSLQAAEGDLSEPSAESSNTQDFPAGSSYEFDEETLKEANALLEKIGQPPVDTSVYGAVAKAGKDQAGEQVVPSERFLETHNDMEELDSAKEAIMEDSDGSHDSLKQLAEVAEIGVEVAGDSAVLVAGGDDIGPAGVLEDAEESPEDPLLKESSSDSAGQEGNPPVDPALLRKVNKMLELAGHQPVEAKTVRS